MIDQDTDAEINYQIVGDLEADLKDNRISISSPFARALIGKEEGDVAKVAAPGGVREYEVNKIFKFRSRIAIVMVQEFSR